MSTHATPATVPRLAALVRLLLQLRMMLASVALLLLPPERQDPATIAMILAFALLSGLAARYWERYVPYLLKHPLLATLDIVAASAILAVDGPSGPMFVTTILSATIAGVLFGGRGVAAVTAFQILCYVGALFAYVGLNHGMGPIEIVTFQVLLVHPLLYPIAGYVGMRIGAILTELAAEQEARRKAELAAAAAEERDKLARDMHDSVAKTLRGAALAAQALPTWIAKDPERAALTATQVAEAAEVAAGEARDLIAGLRDGSAIGPFQQTVAQLVHEWAQESGIRADVEDHTRSLEPFATARQESLAILKEALTNIQKHAEATMVTVDLTEDHGHSVITVSDNGKGFDVTPESVRTAEQNGNGHYGVLGMSERAIRAEGTLNIDSDPGRGTRLRIRVPAGSTDTLDRQKRSLG